MSEASDAIGNLAPASALPRFDARLGSERLAVMLRGYSRFLARRDIGIEAKAGIVTRLSEVASPEIKRFFGELCAQPPAGLPQRVRTQACTAGARISPTGRGKPVAAPPRGAPP